MSELYFRLQSGVGVGLNVCTKKGSIPQSSTSDNLKDCGNFQFTVFPSEFNWWFFKEHDYRKDLSHYFRVSPEYVFDNNPYRNTHSFRVRGGLGSLWSGFDFHVGINNRKAPTLGFEMNILDVSRLKLPGAALGYQVSFESVTIHSIVLSFRLAWLWKLTEGPHPFDNIFTGY
jgi:hypothetical protein